MGRRIVTPEETARLIAEAERLGALGIVKKNKPKKVEVRNAIATGRKVSAAYDKKMIEKLMLKKLAMKHRRYNHPNVGQKDYIDVPMKRHFHAEDYADMPPLIDEFAKKKSGASKKAMMENDVLDRVEYSLAELQKDQAEGLKEIRKKRRAKPKGKTPVDKKMMPEDYAREQEKEFGRKRRKAPPKGKTPVDKKMMPEDYAREQEKEFGQKRKVRKKRALKKLKTDLGRNEERMLEGRLHMMNKDGKLTRKVIGRVGRTDPTHWKSGTASKNWKRYTKDSKVPWQRTSRMNTDLSYRYSHWPPAKFIREDYLVVPYVRCMQHGNPYMKGKRLVEYEKNGKRYHRVANASAKKKSKK